MIDFEMVHKYTKDLRLLYVEDDELLRNANIKVFERFFSVCVDAYDGVDGLLKYKDSVEDFDLIITDLNMPRMDGQEMIRKILEINTEQSIIVVSAHNDSEKLLELIAQGITNFILKPVSPQLLLQILYKSCKTITDSKLAQTYHQELQEKVNTQVEALRKQDQILMHQAKLASMGEMLDAVAHQWLQPLNVISSNVELLQMDFQEGKIDKKALQEFFSTFEHQTMYLQDTLHEFRAFFRPNENIKYESISDIINNALLLSKDELTSNQIEIVLDIKNDPKIKIATNGLKHVILNLLSNSRDAFVEHNIKERIIKISTLSEEEDLLLCVEDNAGGIEEKILEHIFEAHYTTKGEGKGTGIGLYMTKIIIEKLNADIEVNNSENGVKFSIKLPIA